MCNRPTVSVLTAATGGPLVVALLAVLFTLALVPSTAVAGPRSLDDAEFIRGLKQRGMKDLIIHFIEKNPPSDPIERIEVLIEQKKLILDDEDESPEKRREAGLAVVDLYRQLIKEAEPVHWKQIVWKVEYVTYLFEVVLPRLHLNAAEFVEFGVPTQEQREHFNTLSAEAYKLMEEAGDQWFMMPILLPKKDNFEEDFVNNGRWRMLKDDFAAIRLPFYRSWARLYYSMTPDGAARGGKMTQELEESLRFIDSVARQTIPPGVVTKLRSLQGRIQLALGDHTAADKALTAALGAIAGGTSQMDVLVTKLAKVQTIAYPGLAQDSAKPGGEAPKPKTDAKPDAKPADKKTNDKKPQNNKNQGNKNAGKKGPEGQPGASGDATKPEEKDDKKAAPAKKPLPQEVVNAVAALHGLKKEPLVAGSPMLLVLVYDLQFRLTNDYDVYLALFEDPALKGRPQIQQAVEGHVYARLADMKVEDFSSVPPLVVMAQVEFNMLRPGMELHNEAKQLEGKAHNDKVAETKTKLAPAVKALKDMLERDDLSKEMAGKALFKLGITYFHMWDFFNAADSLLTLAEHHPQDSNATGAMKNSIALVMQVYRDNPEKDFVKAKVEHALKVLLEKYPQLPEAKTHQYTWAAMLRQAKDYAKAIKAYEQIDAKHEHYALAQYEKLICMHAMWLDEPGDSEMKPKLAGAIPTHADTTVKVIDATLKTAEGDKAQKLKRAQGDSLLIKAEALGEGLNQIAPARAMLQDFDQQFGEFPELINAKKRLNINLHIRAGDVDKAKKELTEFINQFPEEGGALIRGVLESVNRMARDKELLPGGKSEAQELYQIGVEIAEMLLNWAKRKPEYKDPAKLLPFQLILAEQYIAAKRFEDAMTLLEGMFAKFPKNMDIMLGLAKAYYAQGIYEPKDPANPLSGTLPLCNKIINNTQPNPPGSNNYPETYWDVWALRLQSVDKQLEELKATDTQKAQDKGLADVYQAVRRLELISPDLGGGDAAAILTRLKIKWQK